MFKRFFLTLFVIPFSLIALDSSVSLEKKTAVVGTGLPGVGKSTLLRALSGRVEGSVYLDKDVINQTLLRGNAYSSEYYKKHVKNQSYELMFSIAGDNLKNSTCTVILDGMFGDKLSSPMVKPFLESSDFAVKVIYFYCSPELNQKRLENRGYARDDEKLKDFQNYYHQTVDVHQKELSNVSHLSIDTENDLEENLKLIIEYLAN